MLRRIKLQPSEPRSSYLSTQRRAAQQGSEPLGEASKKRREALPTAEGGAKRRPARTPAPAVPVTEAQCHKKHRKMLARSDIVVWGVDGTHAAVFEIAAIIFDNPV